MSQAATGLLSPDYLSITSYNLDDANIGICALLQKSFFFLWLKPSLLAVFKVTMVSHPEAYSRD